MDSRQRINNLARRVEASGQQGNVAQQLLLWQSVGPDARMLGFRLRRRRVQCPSCGMQGASFEACDQCGGPACDNCRNLAGKQSICALCSGAI